MYQGRLLYGGQVIADNALTYARMEAGDCRSWLFRQDECPTGAELSPDVPPWNDPTQADLSNRFHGLYVWEVRGLSDTFRSTQVIEGVTDGADVGRTRRTARQVRVVGSLFAKGRDALDYGMSWLSSALDGDGCGQHGGRCGVTDFEWLTECPPERISVPDYTPWSESRRNLAPNPRMENDNTGWGVFGGTLTATATGARADFATANAADALVFYTSPAIPDTPGVEHYGSLEMTVPTGYPAVRARLYLVSSSPSAEVAHGEVVTINPGETVTLTALNLIPTPAGTTVISMALNLVDRAAGTRFIVRRALLQNIARAGDYFDGDTTDTEFARYSWSGAAGASASIAETRAQITRPETDAEYLERIAPLRRFLHDVACTSGPLQTAPASERDDWWRMDVEFTLTAGVPWVFSATRAVQLPISPTTLVQDTPFNLAPYPSAERSIGTVVVATNYSTNPSLETDATGWGHGTNSPITGDMVTSSRVTGELAAVGTASYRAVFAPPSGNTAPGGDPAFWIEQQVNLSGRPANSRVSFTMWAAEILMSGGDFRLPISFDVVWRSTAGGPILRVDSLGTVSVNGGAITAKGIQPPPAAFYATVRAIARVNGWSAGTVLRLYADALAVTVP